MVVTEITELSRSRCRIRLDGEETFVLYRSELRRYHVEEGRELSEEDYRAITEELLPKRATLRAMNLLKEREYTTAQLREKLRSGDYPERAVDEALAYVASYHYTDDLRYAVGYITYHESDRSRRRIEQDLRAKGIDEETLEQAWSEWEAQGGTQDEETMIRALLVKRRYDPETADYRETAKQTAFLMRKGYSAEAIRNAIKDF